MPISSSAIKLMMGRPADKLPWGAPLPIASNWCHSVSEFVKVDFEWTIHHFEFLDGTFESTQFSPDVSNKLPVDLKWKLYLDNQGIKFSHDGTSGLTFTTCKGISDWQVASIGIKCRRRFRIKTAVINKSREKVFFAESFVRTGMEMPVIVNELVSLDSITNKANDYLVNGNLTIYCEIETLKDTKDLSGRIARVHRLQSINCKDQLAKDFEELFANMQLTDVTLVIRGHNFQAHKIVLAARSPVFSAMFQHETKEKLTDVVEIPDIEPEVFQELLRYIYTGQVPSNRMNDIAVELLVASDKYLIEKCKQECEDYLIKWRTAENCIKVLAMDQPTNNLRKTAEDFIHRRPVEVVATDHWKSVNIWNFQLNGEQACLFMIISFFGLLLGLLPVLFPCYLRMI